MADDDLNISVNVDASDASSVIKKLGKDVNALAGNGDNLTKALKKTGVAALNAFNKLDVSTINKEFAKLSTGEISKLSVLLREAGISLSQFLSGEKILDPAIGQAINQAISDLNELQAQFNRPLSIRADFETVDDVFAASRNLLREVRQEARQVFEELTDTSRSAEIARQFEPIYELRRALAGDDFNKFQDLINFEKVQTEADSLVSRVEKIKERLIEIGPAASTGNEDAVAEFLQLKQSLDDAQKSAQGLQQRLADVADTARGELAGVNLSLQGLGFDQIKLDDIFPSAEQRKVAELQRKIDQAVRDSVQEGAVKRTLNFFLAQDRQLKSVDKNVVSLTSHLPRLRYALYDVANTATIFGGALVGAIGATVKFAADFERSFADVIRTTGVAGSELRKLRNDLINLSQEIPVSFADLADIATLAGQLNVANDVIDEFTATVAKFSATTDVSIEQSATAFGRLDQLVNGVNGQFEKLGSAILKVGVNAVATESDIIAISTQIASVANVAGFTAAELVGFSSALASVGTRPELARGTFTRLFTEIQQSVAGGGEQLDYFAKLAGQSAEEFQSAWGAGSGAEQVVAVLRGLNVAGNEADQALAQIGITSVRDVPTLLKLAQSVEEVERQIQLAKLGFLEGTELQEQYGVITETLSEKLSLLKNNFTALTAAFGGLSGPISLAVDGLNILLRTLEELLQNPVGKFVGGTVAAFGALLGVSALAVGAFARLGGSIAGAGTAMTELFETIGLTKIQIDQLTGAAQNKQLTDLKDIALTKAATAARQKAVLQMAKQNIATKSATVNTIKYNTSLTVLRARLATSRATLSAYTARVRLAGAAAASAARQTKLYSTALTTLKTAGGLGIFLLVTFAIEKAVEAMGLLNKETQDVSERFDNWGAILEAVKQDTNDFNYSLEASKDNFEVIGKTAAISADEVSDYGKILAVVSGESDVLQNAIDGTTSAFESQSVAIGANTKALLEQKLAAELLAASQIPFGLSAEEYFQNAPDASGVTGAGGAKVSQVALSQVIQNLGLTEDLKKAGFDFKEFTDLITSGNVEAANSYSEKLGPAAQDVINILSQRPGDWDVSIKQLSYLVTDGAGALRQFTSSGSEVIIELKRIAFQAAITGTSMEDSADGVSAMNDAFKSIVDNIYGPINAQRELEDSMRSLGTVFFEEGSQVAATSKELQDVLNAIWVTSGGGEQAAKDFAGFYQAIIEGGYATEAELKDLQQTVLDTFLTFQQVSLDALQKQRALLNRQIGAGRGVQGRIKARKELTELDAQIKETQEVIDGFNFDSFSKDFDITPMTEGFNTARESIEKTAEAVDQVKEEVRTLLDYAGDLENVFSRAFDIRFGALSGIDAIAAAWESFTDNVNDAKNAVQELKDTQDDLAADVAIKEYFLSVAEAYDDQLRAAKLRTEIADIEKQQADAAKALADAQAQSEGATDLTGQSEQGRQNRGALLGLVKNYQDYITVLAESGASQDELRKATERARKEFIAQATELGFAESEVMMYAEAFDDVRTAIDRVPRDITIDFNADPALQALSELNAKLDQSIEKARELNRQQRVEPSPTPDGTVQVVDQYEVIVKAKKEAGIGLSTPVASMTRAQRAAIGLPYYDGGFTGQGGKYQPAGVVHKGEYVVPQKYVNQSTGLPDANFLAQLQNGVRGYAQGGFVGGGMGDGTMMVELSPYDRKLLADAGNVQLRVDGKVVASATNRSNFNEARRGSN